MLLSRIGNLASGLYLLGHYLTGGNKGWALLFTGGANQLGRGVLLGTKRLKLLNCLAPLGVGGYSIINQRFGVSAGTLAGLDGIWVFTKQIWVNHRLKPTF